MQIKDALQQMKKKLAELPKGSLQALGLAAEIKNFKLFHRMKDEDEVEEVKEKAPVAEKTTPDAEAVEVKEEAPKKKKSSKKKK